MTSMFAHLQGLVPALGWTLAHFLWQGALVALALEVVLKACRTPRARHDWALAALVLMAALPAVTFAWLRAGVPVVLVPPGFPGALALGQRWETFAVAGWALGVAALAARLAGGLVVVERLRRSASPLPAEWVARCRALERRLAAPLRVAFAQSQAVAMPVVAGWLKPMVLVPAGFLARMPAAELEALILHELAHVRRLDALANLVQSVVETLLFYHPAVWWVSRRVRLEREHCCDELAVAAVRDPALYVRALQSLETLRVSPYGVLAAGGGDLRRRAARILGLASAPERPALSRPAAVATLALAGAAMGQGAAVQAETSPSPARPAVGARPTPASGEALTPIAERSAPPPVPPARLLLASTSLAASPTLAVPPAVALAADPPLLAAPAASPAEPAAQAHPVAYNTIDPLVVSPLPPIKPDVRFEVGGEPKLDERAPVAIWPVRAAGELIDARVMLDCRISIHGLADDCSVLSETPANRDFGATALALRASLRFPPSPDGAAAGRKTVEIDFKARVEASSARQHWQGNDIAAAPGLGGGGPRYDVIDRPAWIRAATFEDLAAARPAGLGDRDAFVVEVCAVRRDGELEGCRVLYTDTNGPDIAHAALALSRRFRVSPQQVSALHSFRHALWVQIPIRFPSAGQLPDRTVTAPRWVAGFDKTRTPAVFPPEAAAAGVTSGRGVARCVVAANGALTDCAPDGAEPGGLGFGSAAARLASTLRMTLWSDDASPVQGGVVHVPIRLNLKGASLADTAD